MSDIILKKIVSGQQVVQPGKQAHKLKKGNEFNEILKKEIGTLDKVRDQRVQLMAALKSGNLEKLNDVRRLIRQTSENIQSVVQSRQKVNSAMSAYNKTLKDSKKG